MFTQDITPTENPVTFEVPKNLLGHKLRVTAIPIDEGKTERAQKLEGALAFWKSQQVDLSNFKFDREEANER